MELKGKRTQIVNVLQVLVAFQAIIPAINVFPKDISVLLVGLLGVGIAYFRKQA